MPKFFTQKNNSKLAIFCCLLVYLTGSLNDVLMKLLGDKFNFVEISFFRFFFSTITVFLTILIHNKNLLKTNSHKHHAIRGTIGSVAVALCCLGVNIMPIAENTTILFTEAVFILPLAAFLLKEKISNKSIIALIIGFIGLIIIFKPDFKNIFININAIVPTTAAILFAILSISAKKLVNDQEHPLTITFYFGIYSTLIASFFLPFFWKAPNLNDLLLMFLLGGLGANLIQVFLYIAYKMADASKLSPIRYSELPFAVFLGYIIFDQIPDISTIVGAVLIIGSTLITMYETKK